MTSSAGLLEFYILEAGEYIDRLDALLGSAGTSVPDPDALVGTARALRGSSTMAKLHRIAELAGCIERIGRASKPGGGLRWTYEVHQAVVAAIDDLRILLRGVRMWGESEERRATDRISELRRFTPAESGAPSADVPSAGFFAAQGEAVAAALDDYLRAPGSRGRLDDALRVARSLRGVAALRDHPPLAEAVDAVERAARGLGPDAADDARAEVLRTASAVLREAAASLRTSGRTVPSSPTIERFIEATAAADASMSEDETVVPIAELYFADAGPHLVSRGAHPPLTATERFRRDAVAPAEHVRRLVGDARLAQDPASRDRAARELRAGVASLRRLAESFGEGEVAASLKDLESGADAMDPLRLAALDIAAKTIADPSTPTEEVARRLSAARDGRLLDDAIGRGFAPLESAAPPPAPMGGTAAPAPSAAATTRPTPVPDIDRPPTPPTGPVPVPYPNAASPRTPSPTPTAPRAPIRTPASVAGVEASLDAPSARRAVTPTGRDLQDFLQDGLAGLTHLDSEPLSEPVPLDDAAIVPIESLLYRGPAALRRAIEVRDEIRQSGSRPSDDALAELFDLLDLAAAE